MKQRNLYHVLCNGFHLPYPYGSTIESGKQIYFIGLKNTGSVTLSEAAYGIANFQLLMDISSGNTVVFDDCEDCASILTLYVMNDGRFCHDAAKFSEAVSIVHITVGKGSMVWKDSNEYNFPSSVKASNITDLCVGNTSTTTTNISVNATEALKNYAGNTTEFNAYYYYVNYQDLQAAFGANGDALLSHWNSSGKSEGRVANRLK